MLNRFSAAKALLGLAIAALGASASAEDIPMISVDRNGHSQVQFVSDSDYYSVLESALSAVPKSMMPALRKLPARSSAWRLRMVKVALGVSASIKLKPIGDLTISSKFSLQFTDGSIDPDPIP